MRGVTGAFVVALVLRMAFALGYWIDKPLTLDEQEYLMLAGSVVAGRGFEYPATLGAEVEQGHFQRPPGFPLVLAGVLVISRAATPGASPAWNEPSFFRTASSSDVPIPVKCAQAILGAVGVLLISVLARRAAGPAAAVLAAWIAAVYPPLVWTSGYVLSEPLYSVLALGTALLLAAADSGATSRSRLFIFSAGAVGAAAVMTREVMLLFLALAIAWLLWRRKAALAALLAAGIVAGLAPWAIQSRLSEGRMDLGTGRGGINFWIGNNPLARGEGDMAANPEIKRAAMALEARFRHLTPREMDRLYYREAMHYIGSEPLSWIFLVCRKLFYTFVPVGPSVTLRSPRYLYASIVSYGLLLLPSIAGLAGSIRARRGPWPLWLLGASAVLANLIFFPQERFRVPVIDPVLIVLAAAWGATLLQRRTA